MTKQRTSIAIIGGGCAGWSLGLELAQQRIPCIVIDQNPPALFASTRNQGWLQSGALYAMLEDPITMNFCRQGYHLIRSRFADVIRPGIPGYFLFYHREEFEQAIEQCYTCDITVQPVSMQGLREREAILGKSRLAYALQVPDVPLDTSKLLQRVAYMACQQGVHFCPTEDLSNLSPRWDGEEWHIVLDKEREIVCKGVVLTCGAYIPEMLDKFILYRKYNFRRTKNPVLVLNGNIANSMLMVLHQPQSPQLIPFNGPAGNGVTICLSHVEEGITDYRDKQLPSLYLEQCAEALVDFYEGFKMAAARNHYQAHAYVCQKLSLHTTMPNDRYSRGPIIQSYAQSTMRHSVFVFYPGKFTSALIAAADCMKLLESCLGDLGGTMPRTSMAPIVARQKYYDQPQYSLTLKGEKLVFDPVLNRKGV